MSASNLTHGEIRALALYAETGSQAAAAHLYGCALNTFKNYMTEAYRKLECSGAIEAFTVLGWLKVPASAYESPIDRRLREHVG